MDASGNRPKRKGTAGRATGINLNIQCSGGLSMRISLRHFLYKIKEAESDRCRCDQGSQTPGHVLIVGANTAVEIGYIDYPMEYLLLPDSGI